MKRKQHDVSDSDEEVSFLLHAIALHIFRSPTLTYLTFSQNEVPSKRPKAENELRDEAGNVSTRSRDVTLVIVCFLAYVSIQDRCCQTSRDLVA